MSAQLDWLVLGLLIGGDVLASAPGIRLGGTCGPVAVTAGWVAGGVCSTSPSPSPSPRNMLL